MNKPIITINKFANMGDNGLYFLDGLETKQLNGQDILTPSWYCSHKKSNTESGWSGFTGVFNGMSLINFDHDDMIIGIASNKIFCWHSYINSYDVGHIHSVAATGSGVNQILFCNNPDVFTTKNGNLLYTSSNHLGRGLRGQCHADSGTTKIVDEDGRNFDTLGYGTTAGKNKVVNLNTGEIFTITSITDENATKDCLNFTAGSNSNSENDYFMVFKDDFKKFETSYTKGNHFTGQDTPVQWKRQIEKWGDNYYILNGNYIATLNDDESTFSETTKQLFSNVNAVCFSINGERMLVGGDFRGSGKLLLWDGNNPGWLNEINIDKVPVSIKPYKNGWTVLIGTKIYFTDGYQLELISQYPDTNFRDNFGCNFDGMVIVDDKIFISSRIEGINRQLPGIVIFDFAKGWIFTPFICGTSAKQIYKTGDAGALFSAADLSIPRLFCSVEESNIRWTINYIHPAGSSKNSVIFYVKLPCKMKINVIELSLMAKHDSYTKFGSTVVTVNYGEGKNVFWQYAQAGTNSTTTLIKNGLGASQKGKVGQEILMRNKNVAGERSYITAVANPGTANEEWTISPALSAAPTENTNLFKFDLRKAGQKTFSDKIPDELLFNVDKFFSDKLFIEVIFNCADTQLDLHSVNIY